MPPAEAWVGSATSKIRRRMMTVIIFATEIHHDHSWKNNGGGGSPLRHSAPFFSRFWFVLRLHPYLVCAGD